jgi:hypothetical protein
LYGVIGEDKSDVETLAVLIQRLADSVRVSIKKKGFCGSPQMLRKGSKQLRLFLELGCDRFVVCYDADRQNPRTRYQKVVDKVVKPSGLSHLVCILIPVQELEAWILADVSAGSNIFNKWSVKEILNPETINSPKEYLEKLSKKGSKPRYSHATHNQRIAKYLDLDKVQQKCPSFLPLVDLVVNASGNYP